MNLASLTHLILVYRYWILFPLACFEGPIVAFAVGALVALGYFTPLAAYLLLVFGDIIPDTAYYFLGRFGEKKNVIAKHFSKVGIGEAQLQTIRTLWFTHTGKTMFFSKLAYGLSTPFLISAGLFGLELKTFLRYALPVTFAQYAILMGLGYFFGASYYQVITESFNGVGIVLAAAIVVGTAYFFFSRFMRDKLLEEGKEAEQESFQKKP